MLWWVLVLIFLLTGKSGNSNDWSSSYEYDDDDEPQPVIINENLDAALEELWPMVIKNGNDKTELPDIIESFSYRPLFINYKAALYLTNGLAWNIRNVVRTGNAYMNLHQTTLQLSGNILIDRVDFTYDFKAQALGLVSTSGTVVGHVLDTIVFALFSINLNDTDVHMDDLQIVSFGDMTVQLKSNAVLRWLSEPVLGAISQLLKTRIRTTISDGVRNYTQSLLHDVNKHDRLHIKNYVKILVPIKNLGKDELKN